MLDKLATELEAFDGMVAPLARELVERLRQLTRQIDTLEAELRPLARARAVAAGSVAAASSAP